METLSAAERRLWCTSGRRCGGTGIVSVQSDDGHAAGGRGEGGGVGYIQIASRLDLKGTRRCGGESQNTYMRYS